MSEIFSWQNVFVVPMGQGVESFLSMFKFVGFGVRCDMFTFAAWLQKVSGYGL